MRCVRGGKRLKAVQSDESAAQRTWQSLERRGSLFPAAGRSLRQSCRHFDRIRRRLPSLVRRNRQYRFQYPGTRSATPAPPP